MTSTTTPPAASSVATKAVALVGNPNVGKTTLFNALTGLSQRTGNFAGVTVEKKVGNLKTSGQQARLIDLPGTYSLSAASPDEMVVTDVLLGQRKDTIPVDAIVVVVDASNLERNLYLLTQVLECPVPVIVALNMSDLAVKKGLRIDHAALSQALDCKVVPVVAHRGKGINELLLSMQECLVKEVAPSQFQVDLGEKMENALARIVAFGQEHRATLGREIHRVEALRILLDPDSEARERLMRQEDLGFEKLWQELRDELGSEEERVMIEPEARYQKIEEIIEQVITYDEPASSHSFGDKADSLLTHPLAGSAFFLLIMALVFQAIYSWAGPLMDTIDEGVALFSYYVAMWLPDGAMQSLIVDGVIAGIGAVVIFLPQILILFAFISLLEDCGYMARAAFLMDKVMRWAGLSGHSFVPMLSSFACAIPGIMATRTIENRRDRFTTILVAPLMSCSARLPVYTIMIAAFIPQYTYLNGWISLQGIVLLAMYLVGVVVAIPVAWLLKRTILKGKPPKFVMEMPAFKWPDAKTVLMRVYHSGKAFLVRAGTVIFAITIVIWALAYFPRSEEIAAKYEQKISATETLYEAQQRPIAEQVGPDLNVDEFPSHPKVAPVWQEVAASQERNSQLQQQYPEVYPLVKQFHSLEEKKIAKLAALEQQQQGEYLRNSIMGRVGIFLEPVFKPLGWNWKIGISAIASFPARKVIIATLGIIYNLGTEEDEESPRLKEALTQDVWPDGKPVFTPLVALSIMIFFALCCQCGATLAVIWRETRAFRWSVFTFVYMTGLAYLAALATYQFGSFLGY